MRAVHFGGQFVGDSLVSLSHADLFLERFNLIAGLGTPLLLSAKKGSVLPGYDPVLPDLAGDGALPALHWCVNDVSQLEYNVILFFALEGVGMAPRPLPLRGSFRLSAPLYTPRYKGGVVGVPKDPPESSFFLLYPLHPPWQERSGCAGALSTAARLSPTTSSTGTLVEPLSLLFPRERCCSFLRFAHLRSLQ